MTHSAVYTDNFVRFAPIITGCVSCCTGVPDAPNAVSVRYKSSTTVSLDVEQPADDGGERIVGYRVEYDHNKVLEFRSETGMLIQLRRYKFLLQGVFIL